MWDVRNENDVYYRNDDMRIWESRSWINKKRKISGIVKSIVIVNLRIVCFECKIVIL